MSLGQSIYLKCDAPHCQIVIDRRPPFDYKTAGGYRGYNVKELLEAAKTLGWWIREARGSRIEKEHSLNHLCPLHVGKV